jgi:phosphoenolpyruvate carboxykinase (ATP)
MHNMLIRPTAERARELRRARLRDLQRRRLPGEQAHRGHDLATSIDLSFERREFVILGTEYAGEMKKGVFTIMNYLMPKQGVLSMHCSATMARTTAIRRSSSACRAPARPRCRPIPSAC